MVGHRHLIRRDLVLLARAATKASSQNGQRTVSRSGSRAGFSARAVKEKIWPTTGSFFGRMCVIVVPDEVVLVNLLSVGGRVDDFLNDRRVRFRRSRIL